MLHPPAELLDAALRRRAGLSATAGTDSYRLLHRAFDGFPGLAVDKFNDVLIAHLDTDAGATPPRSLLEELRARSGARSVYVKYRPVQANILTGKERAGLAPDAPLLGDPVDETVATENGAHYFIRPPAGLSVGLFLDMREQRQWVRDHVEGGTVLNCFAYTCAFGIAAQQGGAARVVNLDISRPALEWGKRNAELNGLGVDEKDYVFGDAFDWLKRFARRQQKFDRVILDPPSYSTTRQTRFSVEKDYAALVRLASSVTAPGGRILACANTADVSAAAFEVKVRAGLADRRGRIVATAQEPKVDFPVPAGSQPYLKICLVQLP